jgi:hypothetical protein
MASPDPFTGLRRHVTGLKNRAATVGARHAGSSICGGASWAAWTELPVGCPRARYSFVFKECPRCPGPIRAALHGPSFSLAPFPPAALLHAGGRSRQLFGKTAGAVLAARQMPGRRRRSRESTLAEKASCMRSEQPRPNLKFSDQLYKTGRCFTVFARLASDDFEDWQNQVMHVYQELILTALVRLEQYCLACACDNGRRHHRLPGTGSEHGRAGLLRAPTAAFRNPFRAKNRM